MAVDFIPATSEPAFGSVRQYAATPCFSLINPKNFFCCSSFADNNNGVKASVLASIPIPIPMHPAPNSSDASALSIMLKPLPPNFSGIGPFIIRSLYACFTISHGNSARSSYFNLFGIITLLVKSLYFSWISFCLLLNEKSIILSS